MKKVLSKISLYHLIVIAILSALGIGVKAIVGPMVKIITGALYIPGGVVAGGIYMLFIVLSASLTKIKFAATMCGLIQGIIVMIIGSSGSHGAFSLVTYILPGIATDIIFLFFRKQRVNSLSCSIAGMAANFTGTILVNMAFFSMPAIPLILNLSVATLSGGLGGFVAWKITNQLEKMNVLL